ncbi:hypothetical protein G8B32_10750 [Enterococcus faecalis]|uniref:FIVAR domain-containing protein n=1 Tax=Enterococcus faecalis TaxID=1351 RepID=UPI001884768E|nr:FIVAR domain-containing protein [Enterococcus faecalis]MBE9855097.1 hypothetical protein [Enterococcus faecalis]
MKNQRKKILIGMLCSTVVLGSTGYAIWNNLSVEPDKATKPISFPKKDKNVLKQFSEEKEESILDKVTGSKKAEKIIKQIRGKEAYVLETNEVLEDLALFDRRAKQADRHKEESFTSERQKNQLLPLPVQSKPSLNELDNTLLQLDKPNSSTTDKPTLEIKPPIISEILPPIEPDLQPPIVLVDYTVLEQLVKNAEGLPESVYLSSSYQAMQNQLKVAKIMLTERQATQAQVNAQVEALQAAIDQLVVRGNFSDLEQLVAQVKSIQRENYTTASAQRLDQAYEQATALIQEGEATQERIDEVLNQLNQAIMHLVERGEKAALQAIIDQAKSVDRACYTAESLQALDEAVGQAQQVIQFEDATQAQVDEAVQLVQTAISQLKTIGEPDYSLLQLTRLIDVCEQMDLTEYTEQSVAVFTAELARAKAFISSGEVTEESVQAQLQALQQAKEQLSRKADKTALIQLIQEVTSLEAVNYISDSWETLQQALQEANRVVEDTQATQEIVDTIFTQLENAKQALVEKEEQNKENTI